MGYTGDATTRQVLEDALGKERDRWARFALQEAIALIQLRLGGDADRVAAAEALGRLRSANAMEPLYQLAGDAQTPPPLAAAARGAIKRIERWGLFTQAIEIAFQGLSLSSILLLMALGLAIVFGLMGVINMAHGELMALGAYATFLMQGWFTAYIPGLLRLLLPGRAAVPFLVSAGAGFLLERGVIRFLYGRPLETLLLTWGVSLMIQQGLRLWFGAANVDVTSPHGSRAASR